MNLPEELIPLVTEPCPNPDDPNNGKPWHQECECNTWGRIINPDKVKALVEVIGAAQFVLTMWTNPGANQELTDDGESVILNGEWWDGLVESGIAPLSVKFTALHTLTGEKP